MRVYCKPEHLHSFVQGVIDATGTNKGVDVLPMYGPRDCIDHYCIRIHNYKHNAVKEEVTQAIHKVMDGWVRREAYAYCEFLGWNGLIGNCDPIYLSDEGREMIHDYIKDVGIFHDGR